MRKITRISRRFAAVGAAGIALATVFATSAAACPVDLTVSSIALSGPSVPLAQQANEFGCTGGNLAPDIEWTGVPAGTQSFAVSLWDENAPSGKGLYQWVAFDVPGWARFLTEGQDLSDIGGKEALNDIGQSGYLGPCPQPGSGPHHYFITIYALDVPTLGLAANTADADVFTAINAHLISKGQFEFTDSAS
ncbi:YbhB/YbcL family Raf kinase inhibitor-like protein [Actinacidiphila oryziradicis]|uniref:YbhB/YbcL family Raf kinase inhibitor-like protein n=1 Tax=Actinacidiphila oryziradicis TaxID=2571141 RepID=A0A4U0S261_9ACTN|nr:YbhB/YbcL family Raf kinase inhibitor-like protein [Actinacidiphila oryziradicis]TKA02930.1 YbhB/YbcL family Raf kinase inhibitor-like protein [Actinacidiphila oryziradicis]